MAQTQNDRAVISLVINGQQAQTSLKQISLATINLRSELNKMKEADNPQLYREKLQELAKLIQAQREMASRVNQLSGAWQRFKKDASISTDILGGNILTSLVNRFTAAIPDAINRTVSFRAELADIAAKANLTDQEVRKLNGELSRLNTTTPTQELRKMAVVAGQFDVAKNQMAGFVDATDKLNVALGDQFSGAEEVATIALTLRNTFRDIQTARIDDDMLRIGNALNVLESKGAATAPVISEFAGRIGGVAIPMGLTTAQTLGLSATLQELNVTAERGAGAVTGILTGMAKAPQEFAKYAVGADGAKLSTSAFVQLLNTDLMAALTAVIRGFNLGDTSATGMAKKLSDLKLNGDGVMEIFLKLATNTAMVEEKTRFAGEALQGTSSIMAEFARKNDALAVNLKKIQEFFSDKLIAGVEGFAESIVGAIAKVMGLRDAVAESITAANQQKETVQQLEKNLLPLIARYETLTGQTNLSKQEQTELRKVVGQISEIVPIAVGEWDKYGNALTINAGKAREFINVQRELYKFKNADAINTVNDELTRLRSEYGVVDKQLRAGIGVRSGYQPGMAIAGGQSTYDLSNDELKSLKERRKKLGEEIVKNKLLLSGLDGSYLDSPKPPATGQEPAKNGEETDPVKKRRKTNGTVYTTDEEKRANKRANDEIRAMAAEAWEDEKKRELEKARYKADKQIEEARTSEANARLKVKWVKAIEDAYQVEKNQIEEKFAKEQRDRQMKNQEQFTKDVELALEQLKQVELAGLAADKAANKITEEEERAGQLKIEANFLEARKLLYEAHYKEMEELAQQDHDKAEEIRQKKQEALQSLDAEDLKNKQNQGDAANAIAESEQEERQTKDNKKITDEQQLLEKWLGVKKKTYKDATDVLRLYFKENTVAYKAGIAAQKAWAIAEITITFGKSLMDAVKAGAGLPFPANLAAIAKSAAIPTLTYAAALARIRSASESVPGFLNGGFTEDMTMTPGGYYTTPTYFPNRNYTVTENGRPEFVINNRALQVPVVANFARMIDSMQQSGSYGQMTAVTTSATDSQSALIVKELQGLRAESQRTRAAITALAERPVEARMSYFHFQETTDRIAEIRRNTSL